jgi:hypothetical protein
MDRVSIGRRESVQVGEYGKNPVDVPEAVQFDGVPKMARAKQVAPIGQKRDTIHVEVIKCIFWRGSVSYQRPSHADSASHVVSQINGECIQVVRRLPGKHDFARFYIDLIELAV